MFRQGLSGPPLLACCAACLILIALILGAIAVAIPDWETGDVQLNANGAMVNRKVGLWEICGQILGQNLVNDECVAWNDYTDAGNCQDTRAALDAMRAIGIIALIALLFALCLVIAGALLYNIFILVCAGCLITMAVILQIILLIIFSALVANNDLTAAGCTLPSNAILAGGEVCPDCVLSWGFWLTLVSLLLGALALCLTCCACFLRRRRPSLKPPITTPPVSPPYMAMPPTPHMGHNMHNMHHMHPQMVGGVCAAPCPPIGPCAQCGPCGPCVCGPNGCGPAAGPCGPFMPNFCTGPCDPLLSCNRIVVGGPNCPPGLPYLPPRAL